MQIVPPGQPLRQPNICFICEQWPNPASGLPTVDVLRDFEANLITKLTGRKYVCHACAEDIGHTVGMVWPDEVEAPAAETVQMTLGEMLAALGEALPAEIGETKTTVVAEPESTFDPENAMREGITVKYVGGGYVDSASALAAFAPPASPVPDPDVSPDTAPATPKRKGRAVKDAPQA